MTSLTAPGPKSCNDTNSPAEFDQVISTAFSRLQVTTDRTGITRTGAPCKYFVTNTCFRVKTSNVELFIAILMISDSSSKSNPEIASNLQDLRDNFDYVLVFTTNKAGDQDRINLFRFTKD